MVTVLTVKFVDVPIVRVGDAVLALTSRFEVAVLSLLRLTVLLVNPALTVRPVSYTHLTLPTKRIV